MNNKPRTTMETVKNQYGAEFKRLINPARRAKKATGLKGRQWKKYRKAIQRSASA